ncbi:hypothetical protein LR48_Vigan86s002600 [Vigna angularis]|uniref:Uncharacterized protein n=1 Tax=Phaseolus angularis TaxID=3914 RepID=A0A0L9T3Z9_PHAAN|nr:hypothetical protein LR48_Vigan86s002600 [Vigna angularis]
MVFDNSLTERSCDDRAPVCEPAEQCLTDRSEPLRTKRSSVVSRETQQQCWKHILGLQEGGHGKEGEEKDGKGKMVHHDSVDKELKLCAQVRFKGTVWVVKELKDNGVIEIEAPYSRRVKKVTKKMLMSWSERKKKNINMKEVT